jgi:hypothetical protein
VVARNDERLTADELYAKCRRELAGYKQPKEIRFVAFAALPRSTTARSSATRSRPGCGGYTGMESTAQCGTDFICFSLAPKSMGVLLIVIVE